MKKGLVTFVLALGLLVNAISWAQEEPQVKSKPVDQTAPIDITAARVEYFEKDGREVTRFSGGVVFSAATYQINANRIELYQGGEKLEADGQITIHYKDAEKGESGNAKGGHLEYDRVNGYLVMTGSPFLEISQAATEENSQARQIEISAHKLELWTGKNLALATGDVKISRPQFLAVGNKAEFFIEEEKVVLTKSPRITRKQDTFAGEKITFYLNDGKMIIEGNVKGQVTSVNEEAEGN